MSHWASTWAYEQDIRTCGQKFILVALANFADENGFCYPSQETLARMTGQDPRTVRRHLKALEDDNLIRRAPRWREAGGRNSDGYHLLAPTERLKPYRTNDPVSKRSNCPAVKLSRDPLIEKEDPSLRPPISPKRSYKTELPPDPKIRCPEDILERLPELRELCGAPTRNLDAIVVQWCRYQRSLPRNQLRTLEQWSESFQFWIGNEPTNGNGHKHESASERNQRNLHENLEYLRQLSQECLPDHHQSETLLLAAGTDDRRTDGSRGGLV